MLRFPPALFDGFDDILAQEYLSQNSLRTYPKVNMGVTDKSVEVYLFIPGMNVSDIDVTIEKNLLSISGERKPEAELVESEAFNRRERFMGKFKRTIALPEDVNPDQTEAVYRDGILHISVAKKEEVQPRQIKVSV